MFGVPKTGAFYICPLAADSAIGVLWFYRRVTAKISVADPNLFRGEVEFIFMTITNKNRPNNSLQPTAVGRLSSAFAVNHSARRWLSFGR